jgi:hypothetical protein
MYCVNCGVKLGDEMTKCPLCGVKTHRPETAPAAAAVSGVPKQKLSRNGIFFLVTSFTLLVIAISLSIDLSMHGRLMWSGYVTGAMVLLYLAIALPIWLKHTTLIVKVIADWAAVTLYVFLLERTIEQNWFIPVLFPVLTLLGVMTVGAAYFSQKHPTSTLLIAGIFMLLAGLLMIMMELLINSHLGASLALHWSQWVMLGFGVCGAFLLVLHFCEDFRQKLIKRMFI